MPSGYVAAVSIPQMRNPPRAFPARPPNPTFPAVEQQEKEDRGKASFTQAHSRKQQDANTADQADQRGKKSFTRREKTFAEPIFKKADKRKLRCL